MKLRKLTLAVAALAAAACGRPRPKRMAQAKEQFIPVLSYRTGPYAPNGAPWANGFVDYMKLVNAKGGINGVKLSWEECETGYDTARSVECYERLKGKGASFVQPLSTGATFAITEKAPGRQDPGGDRRLRPQRKRRRHRVQVELPDRRHLLGGQRRHHAGHRQEGRRPRQAQGQEDRAGLSRQPLRQGADPAAAGARQACTASSCSCCRWRRPASSRRPPGCRSASSRPDYVVLWGWGVMNSTAIKEAQATGYPREKMYGVWWAGAEPDVKDVGDGAKGYNAVTMQHGAEPRLQGGQGRR